MKARAETADRVAELLKLGISPVKANRLATAKNPEEYRAILSEPDVNYAKAPIQGSPVEAPRAAIATELTSRGMTEEAEAVAQAPTVEDLNAVLGQVKTGIESTPQATPDPLLDQIEAAEAAGDEWKAKYLEFERNRQAGTQPPASQEAGAQAQPLAGTPPPPPPAIVALQNPDAGKEIIDKILADGNTDSLKTPQVTSGAAPTPTPALPAVIGGTPPVAQPMPPNLATSRGPTTPAQSTPTEPVTTVPSTEVANEQLSAQSAAQARKPQAAPAGEAVNQPKAVQQTPI